MNTHWKWLLFAGGSAIALLAVVAVYGLPGVKGQRLPSPPNSIRIPSIKWLLCQHRCLPI